MNNKFKENMFVIICICFTFIYYIITLNLSEILNEFEIYQLNYSIIIGLLMYLVILSGNKD